MFNYYTAKFSVVTARRAILMGIRVSRKYGYYVIITTEGQTIKPPRVDCWCETRYVAEEQAERNRKYQRGGYYGCPCGSTKQARECCGKVIFRTDTTE